MPNPQLGFPRSHRLLSARDFQPLFAQATRSSDTCLTVLARANGLGIPRLGLAISKRQVRLACDRNRIKRICRESFRLHQHGLVGLDLVIMARTPATHADPASLSSALRRHWSYLVKQCKPSWSPSSSFTAIS